MPDYEELLARLRKLEDENHRLAARIDELTAEEPVNRRGMFKRVALGAAALAVGAEVVTAPEAAAGEGDGLPIRFGVMNMGTSSTGMMMDAINAPGLDVNNTGAADRNSLACAIRGRTFTYGVVGMSESHVGMVGMSTLDEKDLLTVPQPAGVAGIGRNPGAAGVYGRSVDNEGVTGVSTGTAGVHGNCQNDNGIGVFGDGSYGAVGVYGHSGRNSGVLGIANEGYGIRGLANTPQGTGVMGIAIKASGQSITPAAVTGDADAQVGLQGVSNTANAVVGTSGSARGGVFTGGAAQVRLVPGKSATPPANGQTGDLYADSAGNLWYCKQGSWLKLA
ncbi:hypothetical protein [Kutzneria chonburiensis]|uniref:Uncharacterized protein n=1 Tax=Kutzneria chonburiensis TaxID=1483604 RepID=A0ABV6MIW9_9PSEU|nr:hypothetical protein [Kutzneria chonburiensis]